MAAIQETSPIADSAATRALELFRQRGGMLRTGEAWTLGIHPRTLYALREAGLLYRLGRGRYRLAEALPLTYPECLA
jgi:hypothetical protein